MKKLISITLICLLLISCVTVAASAKVEKSELPFELIPSKTVSMSKVYDDTSTDMNFSYSMESDMIQFMQNCDDESKREAIMKRYGVEDMYINAQIDWAIDDPTDWHQNEFWNDNEGTRSFGLGYDSDARPRTAEWDVIYAGPDAQSTNECWITRYAGNPLDPTESRWNGTDYEDGVHAIGMKDVLKPDQYTVVEAEPGDGRVVIDYTKHTVYARMRYYVVTSTPKFDELNQVVGYDTNYLFSDWSNAAAYGKDASNWTPPSADTLEAPVISNLTVSSETFNDYPIVAYSQTVSDELNKSLTEVTAHGGTIRIETEARVKGTKEWKSLQGDFDVKSGWNESDILAINGSFEDGTGKPIPAGTEIEFRARYWCSLRLEFGGDIIDEFYSPYSDVLTVTFTKDYAADHKPSTGGDDPKPEKPIKDLDAGATKTQVEDFITSLKSDADPKGSTFGILSAKHKKSANNSITISWNKVKGAKTYVIYGNRCGKNKPYKYLTTVTKTSYTQKKLNKGTYYKYLVTAFNKSGKSISTAKTLHIATKGGKVGNFKKLTTAAKKDKVSLKKGKTFNLKPKAVPESKKLKVSVHRKIQYESSNKKIATVSGGKIKAQKKGTCYIYVYAQSGAFKKIKVTVK